MCLNCIYYYILYIYIFNLYILLLIVTMTAIFIQLFGGTNFITHDGKEYDTLYYVICIVLPIVLNLMMHNYIN